MEPAFVHPPSADPLPPHALEIGFFRYAALLDDPDHPWRAWLDEHAPGWVFDVVVETVVEPVATDPGTRFEVVKAKHLLVFASAVHRVHFELRWRGPRSNVVWARCSARWR